MKEKRVFPRVGLSTIVDYSSSLNARARNVSECGIGILSRRQFEAGTPLLLTFSLPDLGFIKAVAQVMWCLELKSELYLNGLQFHSVKEQDKDKIKKYVQNKLITITDRRRSPRTIIDILIDFKVKGSASTKNLNLSGMCIITSTFYEQGKIILLSMTLSDNLKISVYGRVVWSKKSGPHVYESGIEFLDITEEDQKFLNGFIHNKGRKMEDIAS